MYFSGKIWRQSQSLGVLIPQMPLVVATASYLYDRSTHTASLGRMGRVDVLSAKIVVSICV
jgi:hypothetical protein